MKRRVILKVALIAAVMALGASNCDGPPLIQSLSFCGNMKDAAGQPVVSGTAAYHVIWISDGVTYDSDFYGAPTADVGADGKACFHGGVGFTAATDNFKLVSLTVQVTDASSGADYVGSASNIQSKYDGELQELNVTADFVLNFNLPGVLWNHVPSHYPRERDSDGPRYS